MPIFSWWSSLSSWTRQCKVSSGCELGVAANSSCAPRGPAPPPSRSAAPRLAWAPSSRCPTYRAQVGPELSSKQAVLVRTLSCHTSLLSTTAAPCQLQSLSAAAAQHSSRAAPWKISRTLTRFSSMDRPFFLLCNKAPVQGDARLAGESRHELRTMMAMLGRWRCSVSADAGAARCQRATQRTTKGRAQMTDGGPCSERCCCGLLGSLAQSVYILAGDSGCV